MPIRVALAIMANCFDFNVKRKARAQKRFLRVWHRLPMLPREQQIINFLCKLDLK